MILEPSILFLISLNLYRTRRNQLDETLDDADEELLEEDIVAQPSPKLRGKLKEYDEEQIIKYQGLAYMHMLKYYLNHYIF